MLTPDRSRDLEGQVEVLRQDLDQAREQQEATSEVLSVLGRAEPDLAAVFESVVESASRLCRADAGQIHTWDGRAYRLAVLCGASPQLRQLLEDAAITPGVETLVGKVALQRETIHIPDVLLDPDYDWHRRAVAAERRTMLGVPILGHDSVIGVISLFRTKVDPFSQRQIELVSTFARQGAIAIQNGNLLRALEGRTEELAESVEELQALSDVGQAVSSSLALQDVLQEIVKHAVRLSDTDGGSIFEFDEARQEFRISTVYGTGHKLLQALRAARIRLGETVIGRAAARRAPQAVPDLAIESGDSHLDLLREHGWMSMLALPLLREDRILGALVVRRKTPGEFSTETARLLETFASQSALAIHNAQLFREVEQKSREVEVASRHKSEFLASMSHELRTPLNAVIGFSDVLLEGMFGHLNAKQRDYLEDIRGSGRHLLALLNEILDLSKIEAGRMELEQAPFVLVDAVEGGLRMVRDRAAQHSIRLDFEPDPSLGQIVADERRVKQVIVNLLSNAVKFTPDGGSVDVRAQRLNGQVEVTVRDTGIGIAPEDQARIFESFEQGGRGAQSEEGTGLGLTLCRRIVELHGGRIWVESEPNHGSMFGFVIPAHTEGVAMRDPASPRLSSADIGADDGRPLILLVEDDEHSVDLLSLHLTDAGFRVEVAGDGERGLELARRLRPVGIVLDIILPGLDGWDLLAALKADPAVAGIPVIIVSMLDERGKGFALGAAEYLVKPVGRDDVLTALRRCIAVRGEGRKVLAIDDDPLAIEMIQAVLRGEGFTVLTATGGEEGVAAARDERPEMVLLDLLMPDVDGFAVVERLRADPTTAAIPIVVLTAKDMTAVDKERLNGQISFLADKGEFDRSSLVDLVDRFSRVPSAG